MSFIGNTAATNSKDNRRYNERLAYEQAQYERKKAAVREKVFNTIERPRFVKQQAAQYSNFRNALRTGAELEKELLHF